MPLPQCQGSVSMRPRDQIPYSHVRRLLHLACSSMYTTSSKILEQLYSLFHLQLKGPLRYEREHEEQQLEHIRTVASPPLPLSAACSSRRWSKTLQLRPPPHQSACLCHHACCVLPSMLFYSARIMCVRASRRASNHNPNNY